MAIIVADLVKEKKSELIDTIYEQYGVSIIRKYLSKHDQKDLLSYLNNSDISHISAIIWDLKELCYDDIQAVELFSKYIKDVRDKRYWNEHHMLYEDYSDKKPFIETIKPFYSKIHFFYQHQTWQRTDIVFITQSLQFILFSIGLYGFNHYKLQYLDSLRSWTKLKILPEYKHPKETTFISADVNDKDT